MLFVVHIQIVSFTAYVVIGNKVHEYYNVERTVSFENILKLDTFKTIVLFRYLY